ncbi:energy transducer TonB [Brevundimonas sp.]|uniref:energy transducer TonB n=1 Tax=Brevundimonas sp. TaxID=1871086 RepID=UPI003AFFF779
MMMQTAGGPGLISPIDFGERKKPIPRWMLAAIGVSVILHVAAGVVLYNQRFELSGLAEPTEPDKPIDIFFQRPPEPKPLPPTVTAAPPTPIHKPTLTVPVDVPTVALTPPDNPTTTAPPGQLIVSTAPTGVEGGTATVETPPRAPSVINNPTWASRPSAAQMARAYPSRAADNGTPGFRQPFLHGAGGRRSDRLSRRGRNTQRSGLRSRGAEPDARLPHEPPHR